MDRKIVFDAVRRLLGRKFRAAEVEQLDSAISLALTASSTPQALADTAAPRPAQIGPLGIALIKRFEGCARIRADGQVEAYPDPGTGGAPWTIGWGATGSGITAATVWTQAQCDARLEQDLARYSREVAQAIGSAPTSQQQFDALTSFHYNTGAIHRATLTAMHKAQNYAGAVKEFARWTNAGGRIMSGLVKRRAAEAQLYSSL